METVENNKLIDLFMDCKGIKIPVYDQNGNRITIDYKPNDYYDNWSLLMPVVEKIEALGYLVSILSNSASVTINNAEHIYIKSNFKKEAVYNLIINFIKHYNGLKKI